MTEWILTHKEGIHVGVFLTFLIIFLLCEYLFPRRPFHYSKRIRDISNLSLAFFNNLLLTLTFPVLAVGAGFLAVEKGWGLFQWLHWPAPLEFILGLLLLDLMIYGQHVVFHYFPPLWRLHRVHHADLDLDATTGIRFHPLEIVISMGLKIGFVLMLGTPPLTVFVFELLLMLLSIFNHSNLGIPTFLDRFLRLFIVTPDFHRVHHSIMNIETNSNFGFNFPWWDRLFQTYISQPKDGHQKMIIGINLFRSPKWLYFHRLLIEPFVNKKE